MPLWLPILRAAWSGLWSALSSRAGQIVVAAGIAWVWSGWRADDHWRGVIAQREAAAQAAYRAEVARQERAAVEIAAAATARAEDDAALERELRAQIDAFTQQESPREPQVNAQRPQVNAQKHPACVIDGAFAGVVRRLDAAGRRPARVARRAR